MRISNPHRMLDRITELIGNLKEINKASAHSDRVVELSKVDFILPISFLPIVAYADHMHVSIDHSGCDEDTCDYLGTICFPKGVTGLAKIKKNLLPITRVRRSGRHDILSLYEDRILSQVPKEQRKDAINGLKYLTSELEANVREHACVDDYWIFAQYWRRSGICEIGICDTGIGYRQSYVGTPYEVTTHIDAIKNALGGKSSKKPEERGFGIPTIARVLAEGYKGELIIMSGDSLLHREQGKPQGYTFGFSLPDSFVGLRFRLSGINIYDFI